MSDPIVIRTQARSAEPIVFHIDDDEFKFTPPKLGPMMMALLDEADTLEMTRRMFNDWLLAGLDETDAKRLHDRLADPIDVLDFPDIATLLESLIEVVVARPTRSPSS